MMCRSFPKLFGLVEEFVAPDEVAVRSPSSRLHVSQLVCTDLVAVRNIALSVILSDPDAK